MATSSGRYAGIMGTVVDVTVSAATAAAAARAEAAVVEEVRRRAAALTVFDPDSDLCRWRTGAAGPSPGLRDVLTLAAEWHGRSGGAFHPDVGRLQALWDGAASSDRLPAAGAVSAEVERLGRLSFEVGPGTVVRTGDTAAVTLNGIAKGWIVDQGVVRGCAMAGVTRVTVNAGGDICHHGPAALAVGVEDPSRPYDNAPPLARVLLAGQAVASSGGSRRGWRIGGRWYGHVLDPRTGWPVAHVAAATVVAPDAATADALATSLTVLSVAEGMALVDGIPGVGALVVDRDGGRHRSAGWAEA